METNYLVINKEDWLKGYHIDVSKHVEKSVQEMNYLSWSFAEKYLRENFNNLVVEFERNGNDYCFGNSKEGYYVLPYIVDIETGKRTPSLYYPIIDPYNRCIVDGLMDKNGKPITINTMRINTSLQRARTKIIAITTGIGFSLYNGEDTKEIVNQEKPRFKNEVKQEKKPSVLDKLKSELSSCNDLETFDFILNRWRGTFGKIQESTYKSGIDLLETKKQNLEERLNENQ
jgi:hypothetical protein